jgi:hypothetical protein
MLMELLEWWNLIFLLPAVVAVLYILLLAVGGLPVHDIGLDLHIHDGGADHDLLNVLGLGRIPLSLLLICFCLLWGLLGWFSVQALSVIWPEPRVFIWPALLLALLGAGGITRLMAGIVGRLIPSSTYESTGARDLVGRLAETRYPVSAVGGSVQVHDRHGTLHEVPARVLPGEVSIPAGVRVVLWRYDDTAGSYLVTQDDALNDVGGQLPAA